MAPMDNHLLPPHLTNLTYSGEPQRRFGRCPANRRCPRSAHRLDQRANCRLRQSSGQPARGQFWPSSPARMFRRQFRWRDSKSRARLSWQKRRIARAALRGLRRSPIFQAKAPCLIDFAIIGPRASSTALWLLKATPCGSALFRIAIVKFKWNRSQSATF